MPNNVCHDLFAGGVPDTTYRASAPVVGKTFVTISGDLASLIDITSTSLPTSYDSGNFVVATCGAGVKAVGVAAYDQAANGILPVKKRGKIVPVTTGAAITAGQEVQSDAAGKAIPLATGRPNGLAHNSAAAGDDVFVELY